MEKEDYKGSRDTSEAYADSETRVDASNEYADAWANLVNGDENNTENAENEQIPAVRLVEAFDIQSIKNQYAMDAYLSEADFATKHQGIEAGKKNEEAQKKAIVIYANFGYNGYLVMPALVKADSETIDLMMDDLKFFAEQFDQIDDRYKTEDLKNCYLRVLSKFYNVCDKSNLREERESIARRMAEGAMSGQYRRDEEEICGGMYTAVASSNKGAFDLFCDYYHELLNSPNDFLGGFEYHTKSGMFRLFTEAYGVDQNTVAGYRKIVQMLDEGNPEVEALTKPMNLKEDAGGTLGIINYTIYGLTRKNSPRNLRDIMQMHRGIPTSDFAKFERNRQDALALQGILWEGRDFIHNERPGLHELFVAMINYYDTRNDAEKHEAAEAELKRIVQDRTEENGEFYRYSGFDGKACFDLRAYERPVDKFVRAWEQQGEQYHDSAINILRRLERNVSQFSLEKPRVKDEILKERLDALEPYERADGEILVDFQQVAEVLERMNEILVKNQDRVGVSPSEVELLAYLERMSTFAMRSISGKDYRELAFDPGFKEICKFSELICGNDRFDENEFGAFWHDFVAEASEDWRNNTANAYRMLAQRVTSRLNALAKAYRKEGRSEFMIDSLWSGNLNHELIGLVDQK